MNKTKFNRSTTLIQAIEELEENGITNLTKIRCRDRVYTFEYNIKWKKKIK